MNKYSRRPVDHPKVSSHHGPPVENHWVSRLWLFSEVIARTWTCVQCVEPRKRSKCESELKIYDPISTLPEHLHSTFPSHAKLPENTLTEKKNIPFPSLTLITCLTGPPVTPPPFTGRPSHTLSYTTILFLALKVNGRFLESLPVVTFASLELKLPVFSFH